MAQVKDRSRFVDPIPEGWEQCHGTDPSVPTHWKRRDGYIVHSSYQRSYPFKGPKFTVTNPNRQELKIYNAQNQPRTRQWMSATGAIKYIDTNFPLVKP